MCTWPAALSLTSEEVSAKLQCPLSEKLKPEVEGRAFCHFWEVHRRALRHMLCFEKHWRREFFIVREPYEGNKNDLCRETEPAKGNK